jgi:hypothetical protein
MSLSNQWDALDYDVLDFPYNKIETPLSGEPRIVSGQNSYVTTGGKLVKRPGTRQLVPNDLQSLTGGRIDRLWGYETTGTNPYLFFIASVFIDTPGNPHWEIRTARRTTGRGVGAWTTPTAYRDINLSTLPHTAVVSGGLVYVKSYPASTSSEKLGTIILDGSGGSISVRPWGLLGPQTPARVFTAVTRLNGAISAAVTSIAVNNGGSPFPATPFVIQIGLEQINVTTVVANTFTVVTRGFNGTTATTHEDDDLVIYTGWSPSAHAVEVNYGWTYSYAYKTITGQISNRAPIETNPDKSPSFTGPFFDLIPKITVQGLADTTNIPKINIYRSTDGGGTFYFLEEITNTGAGNITYLDDSLESGTSGGTFSDPMPDAKLDKNNLATSLVSNSPPPAVLAPLVTGVDTPAAATPIVAFQSRLWYGIGNVLFFSAQEELNEGIPEESWPSGAQNGRNGNFYRFQYKITNLTETTDALYIFTSRTTYKLTGNNLETFSPATAFDNIGAPFGQPLAITRIAESVIFLSHDYRICVIENGRIEQISDPLGSDIIDQVNLRATFDLKYFCDRDKEWLIVSSYITTNTTVVSKQWVMDLKKSKLTNKPFWFTPWTIPASCSLVFRTGLDYAYQDFIVTPFLLVSGVVTTDVGFLDTLDIVGSDFLPKYSTDGGLTFIRSTPYTFDVTFHQMLVPAGNHVNKLRQPGATPNVYGVYIDRLTYDNDTDPEVFWYFDDLWTDPQPSNQPEPPARRAFSKGFKSLYYTINLASQHFSARITKEDSKELFEMLRFTVIWEPDGGS